MIQLQGISLALGGQPILDRLSWTIKPGQRIGLIGSNGAGKTTLLRLVAGQLEADSGAVARKGVTGYLAQDVQAIAPKRTVLEEALRAFNELEELLASEQAIMRALAQHAEPPTKLLRELERVQTLLSMSEAHMVRPRTETVLAGLGFDTTDFDRPIATLSGGYRMRVVLAQILLKKPDVLLLDEPTNHLDIVSIDWLEQYLKSYAGTVVLVSHDRYFLNRMVTSIAHLRMGRITAYAGNYDYFLAERKKRRVLEQAAYNNQQREIAQAERFIARFRYKNTKARQVQSRIKQLQKMERLLPPERDEARIRLRFPVQRQSGRVVMALSQFSKEYAAPARVQVFKDAGPLTIGRGDKIALIGKNGAGKSTLARILGGTEDFDGTRKVGHHVDAGFFAQHQAEALCPQHTVLASLQEAATQQTEGELRTLLGSFLFTGDDVFKPVAVLSGGERSRLALARTLVAGTNFLILDEPTNHLDIASIQVLIEALKQYQGSFVVVSHDRHFLDQVANTIWHVGAGRVRVYGGTYSEYQWHVTQGSGEPMRGADTARLTQQRAARQVTRRSGGPKTKAQKRREAEARNATYRSGRASDTVQAQLTQAEEAIAALEARRASVEALLGDTASYDDAARVREASAEYADLQAALHALYKEWESLADQV